MGVYPDQASIYPGDTLRLHVSFPTSEFRVDFYRHGVDLALQFSESCRGAVDVPEPPAPTNTVDIVTYGDWNWPWFDFSIPQDAAPGVWLATLVPTSQPPVPALYSVSNQALFVVKNPNPGSTTSILYKLPLLTYHAYNNEGGLSLYSDGAGDTPPRIGTTLHRPGGGTGGAVWDSTVDSNDPSTPLQTYAHWDSWFVGWLASNGIAVDFCTDLDIHADEDGAMLRSYNLMLSVGHDEYWTAAMRDDVEGFVAAGGNVAFFSGDTCYRQISFDDPLTIRRPGLWIDVGRPENSLTGVSFRNGAYAAPPRPSIGYTVQDHTHWVFDGTGLLEGGTFGTDYQLVGYECDGAMFSRSDGPPFVPTHSDGTPASFRILGVADVSSFGGNKPNQDGNGNLAATMGVYEGPGTVFTGATIDWPRVVGKNVDPIVVQITQNVLGQLSALDRISGRLLFYRDYTQDGTGDVDTPSVIGRGGWTEFKFLFSGGNGIIYAVNDAGQLLFYRDYTQDGTGDVDTPSVIGQGGWTEFKFLFSGGNGIIYAVRS